MTVILPAAVRDVIQHEVIKTEKNAKSRSRSRSGKGGILKRTRSRSKSKAKTRSNSGTRSSSALQKVSYKASVDTVVESEILKTMLIAAFGGAVAHSLAHQKELFSYMKKTIRAEPPPPAVLQSSRLKQVLFAAGIAWQTLRIMSRLYDIAAPTPWGSTTLLFDGLAAYLAVPQNVREILRWRRVIF